MIRLELLQPHAVGTDKVTTGITHATRWRRTFRDQGGPWDGGFFLPAHEPNIFHANIFERRRAWKAVEKDIIETWFQTYLGYRVVEMLGALVTWRGYIWEMELTWQGSRWRIGLEDVFNRVRVDYTDVSVDPAEAKSTSWYGDDISQSIYGVKEIILTEGEMIPDEAANYAQYVLSTRAIPEITPVSLDTEVVQFGSIQPDEEQQPPGLQVTLVGDIFTSTYKYVTVGDNTTKGTEEYAEDIITSDCQFLSVGLMEDVGVDTLAKLGQPVTAWEKLQELAEVGNDSYHPVLVQGDTSGRIHFFSASNIPVYGWYGRDGGLRDTGFQNNPWYMRPGMLRDHSRPTIPAANTGFRLSQNDAWIAEVEMGHEFDNVVLKPEDYDEEEIMHAQAMHRKWIEKELAEMEEEED